MYLTIIFVSTILLPMSIEIVPEYHEAINSLESGVPITFLTGQAGTGKSTIIDVIRTRYDIKIPVLAPTGVAALNVEGQTINSFFQIPPYTINLSEVKILKNFEMFRKMKFLIIDEISMVRADTMDIINHSLRVNRGKRDLPFGGVKLLVIGDLFQLPPVVRTEEEKQYLRDRYPTAFFFGAQCIQETGLKTIELTKVFRQKDINFIRLLNEIREGHDPSAAVRELNSQIGVTEDHFLTITPVNSTADFINREKLEQLPGEKKTYEGSLVGTFDEKRLPAPEYLDLKVGARVMFVKNDTARGRWVNGTMGTVTELMETSVVIERDNLENDPVYVGREAWENIKHSYEDRRIDRKVVGSYSQLPLMPAWAITIHKSQGKTFDRVNIDLSREVFAEGQLYVALSRCRSISGIRLSRSISINDIKVNNTVRKFYRKIVRGEL